MHQFSKDDDQLTCSLLLEPSVLPGVMLQGGLKLADERIAQWGGHRRPGPHHEHGQYLSTPALSKIIITVTRRATRNHRRHGSEGQGVPTVLMGGDLP